MSSSTHPTVDTVELTPREAVGDVIFRIVAAFDEADEVLLASACTGDVILDLDGRRFEGYNALKDDCWAPVSQLDTTHIVGNLRVLFDKEEKTTATAKATYTANHFRPGEGPNPNAPSFTTGGTYTVNCVRDEALRSWKAQRFIVKTLWSTGDRSVMQSATTA